MDIIELKLESVNCFACEQLLPTIKGKCFKYEIRKGTETIYLCQKCDSCLINDEAFYVDMWFDTHDIKKHQENGKSCCLCKQEIPKDFFGGLSCHPFEIHKVFCEKCGKTFSKATHEYMTAWLKENEVATCNNAI